MVRCADFYEKWKKDPNWCQKSPDTVRQIDHYLGLVNELENLGVETVAIYKKFPESVAREVLKIKDEMVRAGVIGNAAGMIKRGDRVAASDIKVWAGLEEAPKKSTSDTGVSKPTIVGSSTSDTGDKPDPSPVTLKDRLPEEPAPTVQTCKDQEKLTGAPVQSPFKTASQVKAGIAGEMEFPGLKPWTPALCKTGPCPDGKSHNSLDKVRGLCCDLTGQPVNQISACPYIERQKKAAAGGFVTAAGNPSPQGKPLTNEHRPYIVTPVKKTNAEAESLIVAAVRGNWTDKEQQAAERVMARLLEEGEITGKSHNEMYRALILRADGGMQ